MRIIKIIKNTLIHLLGGLTKEDRNEWIKWKYYDGKKWAYFEVYMKMESQYGKPADEWCKILYEYVKTGYEDNTETSFNLFDEITNK